MNDRMIHFAEGQIKHNSTDCGEFGTFIKVEYLQNILDDMRRAMNGELTVYRWPTNDAKPIDCQHCNDTGWVGEYTCPYCKSGVGESDDPELVDCDRCERTGDLSGARFGIHPTFFKCPNCGGTGKLPKDEPRECESPEEEAGKFEDTEVVTGPDITECPFCTGTGDNKLFTTRQCSDCGKRYSMMIQYTDVVKTEVESPQSQEAIKAKLQHSMDHGYPVRIHFLGCIREGLVKAMLEISFVMEKSVANGARHNYSAVVSVEPLNDCAEGICADCFGLGRVMLDGLIFGASQRRAGLVQRSTTCPRCNGTGIEPEDEKLGYPNCYFGRNESVFCGICNYEEACIRTNVISV